MALGPQHLDEHEVIALAYEAAMDPNLLPELLRKLLHVVGADTIIWAETRADEQTALGVTQIGLNDDVMDDYARLSWSSPLVPSFMAAGPNIAVTDRMLMDRFAFERSEFFQGWVRANGLSEGLLAAFGPMRQDTVVLTLARERRDTPPRFEADGAVDRFNGLLPYLARAFAFNLRMKKLAPLPSDLSPAALDLLAMAVFCLDAGDGIIWANKAATFILQQRDGLSYSAAGGLKAASADLTSSLKKICRNASGAVRLDRPSGALALVAVAVPYPARPNHLTSIAGFSRNPKTLLFINDPERHLFENSSTAQQIFVARLQSLYHLTRAEAAIAIQISMGQSLPSIAYRLDLSAATVRTHAKHIFLKMRVHNQVQLTRILQQISIIEG